MDAVRDEVDAFSSSSSRSPSFELPASSASSSRAEGFAELLRAALLDQGVEEVGDG